MNKKQKKLLGRILAAAALLVLLHFLPAEGWPRFVLYMVPYLLIGHDVLSKAWYGIRHGQVFDECFLMVVATLGAIVLGLTTDGDYTEAVAVMLFYQTGEWFQSWAVDRSRRSIGALMDIRPDYANLETEDGLEQVDPDEVEPGTVIVIRPGEKVPIDGVVAEGTSSLDAAALTGESLPRDVGPGETVLSGCVNLTGVLRVKTTRAFEASTASRILDLVENAAARKAGAENFITRFARVYTPAVCLGALAVAVVPPLVRLAALGLAPQWSVWLYRALSFLVISCPCALVISIPLTFFAGIGGASGAGVLVKGANFLETLAKTTCVVFDKTGTLTRGDFTVTEVTPAALDREALLETAALAEIASSHPIAKSVRAAWGGEPDRRRVTDIREHSGRGITARVDGRTVAAGNRRLMEELSVPCPIEDPEVGAVLHIAVEGQYAGRLTIADQVKPTAREAVAALAKAGVAETVMLTGDVESAARQAAGALGISKVFSGLLPADKVAKVEELLTARPGGGAVAFVGDGINDAPVLARADVGVAMGAMGSDAAIEAADVVLMDDDPRKLPQAMAIARRCMAIVRENIVFSIGVKVLCLALVALGLAGMWLAVFADVGVMVLAVLNAVRALWGKKPG